MKKLFLALLLYSSLAFSQEQDEKQKIVLEMVTNILDIYEMDLSTLMQYQSIREQNSGNGNANDKREIVLQIVTDMVKLYDIDLSLLMNSTTKELNTNK